MCPDMVEASTFKDALINLFMTLYVVNHASRWGTVDGRVKLQKLLYAVERELTTKNLRGPSFVFYKWDYGPWSPEAQVDLDLLARNNLVTEDKERHRIEPTTQGMKLIQNSESVIKRNREIFDLVDSVISSIVDYRSWQLREVVYGTPLPGKVPIEKVAKGEVVLTPVDEQRAFKFFLIDNDWLDTVALKTSKEFHELVAQIPEKPRIDDYTPIATLRKQYRLK